MTPQKARASITQRGRTRNARHTRAQKWLINARDQINPSIHSHWDKFKFQIFGLLKFSALINMVWKTEF